MNQHRILLLPLSSAILLGLSRTPLPLDMLVFVAFIPMYYYFHLLANTSPIEVPSSQGGDRSKRWWKSTSLYSGIVFGITYMLISIHWITLVTVGGFLGILFLFSACWSLIFWGVNQINRLRPIFFHFSFIAIWLIFEFIWNFSEFSFPWFNIAYGLKNSISLLQVLEIGGVFFISFLILVVNYLFYLGLTLKRKFIGIALAVIMIWGIYGSLRLQYVITHSKKTDLTISMIQGSIHQDEKWEDSMLDTTFEIYEGLSRQAVMSKKTDLLIYPEAALPVYLMMDRDYIRRLNLFANEVQTPIFTGYPHAEFEVKYVGQASPYIHFNAVNLFHPRPIYRTWYDDAYYKSILVPFGERIPFLDKFPILWKLQMGQANFERGEKTVIYNIKDYRFAPLICFEIAFPLYTARLKRQYNPDFWVNVTNDAWFYRSIGTFQHAKMAVFRTIETRKPVFRIANTGYSFYTTPDGQIHELTALFDRTFITGELHIFVRE